MRVLVSGASGLVGKKLLASLESDGHEVTSLVRPYSNREGVEWNPLDGTIDGDALAKLSPEAVVHLAGENIAGGRWTKAQKERIRDSRVQGTRILANALARLDTPPEVFVGASAIGYYGDRGDEALTETSAPGEGYLPDVCREWEAASDPLRSVDTRVVALRIGVVLSKDGGALQKMLLPFKLGMGGRIGSGKQHVSWIAIDDLVAIIRFAIERDDVAGPVNAVAPNTVTNLEMTKALGRALSRPTIFPMPGFVARTVMGEMAKDLLLASSLVKPTVLEEKGYKFRFTDFEAAVVNEVMS